LAREERISIPEALMALTATAAWVGFDETCLGVLRPGARADLAVFDRDPAAIPPDEFETLRCHLTLVDGRVAWSADGHGPG